MNTDGWRFHAYNSYFARFAMGARWGYASCGKKIEDPKAFIKEYCATFKEKLTLREAKEFLWALKLKS